MINNTKRKLANVYKFSNGHETHQRDSEIFKSKQTSSGKDKVINEMSIIKPSLSLFYFQLGKPLTTHRHNTVPSDTQLHGKFSH